jgi:tRNA (cmo5U34)-methyltransferase
MHQILSPKDYYTYITTLFPEYASFQSNAAHLLLSHLTPDALVVDLGCGTGNLASLLGIERPFVLGIDHDLTSLAYAQDRQLSKTQWHYGELPNFDFPPAQAYHASLALHHLNEDWQEAFHKIHAALIPGGIFVQTEMVKSPDAQVQQRYWDELKARLEPRYSFSDWKAASDEVDHFHTLEEELHLLQDIGFKVEVVQEAPPFYQYIAHKPVPVR